LSANAGGATAGPLTLRKAGKYLFYLYPPAGGTLEAVVLTPAG
jgi:hypothetical protein